MLNNTGIKKESVISPEQILADTALQHAVSARVASTGVEAVNGKKIIKAGTPVHGDTMQPNTAYTVATTNEGKSNATGVLVHDIDVTDGEANGSVLIFGFVDTKLVNSAVKALYTSEVVAALKGCVTFLG